jgi:hypothetical protein
MEINKCKRIEVNKFCTLVRCRKRGARNVYRGDEDETEGGQPEGKSSGKKACTGVQVAQEEKKLHQWKGAEMDREA